MIEQLRSKHKRFIYKDFEVEEHHDELVVRYHFVLEPDIHFSPVTHIPVQTKQDLAALRPYIFHLGMVEAISYWKAACPKEFIVEAGSLDREQIRFWYDLIIHGLGEFFYQNGIDFTAPDFLNIICNFTEVNTNLERPSSLNEHLASDASVSGSSASDLVLIGGGKDTAVTLGMLNRIGRTIQTMVVNPTNASLSNIMVAGVSQPIIIQRSLDQTLLSLNANGYLNGHTPYSAYLAFLGILVARLYGNEYVIVSNEQSANEGNVVYRGMEINHQYSKSFRFEQMFRTYVAKYLDDSPSYFSLLRPLNDLQIGSLFASYQQFFPTFRSCNVGSKTNTWCGHCAKCAFTYLMLFPFVPYEDMIHIFGKDYFTDEGILTYVSQLVGLSPVKPFDCVGTRAEAKLAVVLSIDQYVARAREIPEGLLRIKGDLSLEKGEVVTLQSDVLDNWGDTYNLPPEYLSLLRSAWQRNKERIDALTKKRS